MQCFPKFANGKWPFYDHFWAFFANCKNIFVRPNGRMTLGDLDMSVIDGIPALNAYGRHWAERFHAQRIIHQGKTVIGRGHVGR